MKIVRVRALVENLIDVEDCERGLITSNQIRSVELADVFIDTGATGLMLPKRIIIALGLRHFKTRSARSAGGIIPMPMYSVARLTIMGRECALDVGEIPDDLPPLIGQVPLEMLDFVVDLKNQKLIPNPEHGGIHMMDVF